MFSGTEIDGNLMWASIAYCENNVKTRTFFRFFDTADEKKR